MPPDFQELKTALEIFGIDIFKIDIYLGKLYRLAEKMLEKDIGLPNDLSQRIAQNG